MKRGHLLLIAVIVFVFGTIAQGSNSGQSNPNNPLNNSPSVKKAVPWHPIPKRDRMDNIDVIDLTDYYTSSLEDDWYGKQGANLRALPKGTQIFAQNAFDVRGIIQLAGKTMNAESGIDFPKEVKGIKVNKSAKCLHFLQGTIGITKDDTKIGEYLIHYTNGKTATIPIVYQRNVSNWFLKADDQIPTDAFIAWTGENETSTKQGNKIQLYKYSVNNPFPNMEIESVDFISAMTESAPFLIAISMEGNLLGNNKPFRNVKIENSIVKRSPEAGPEMVDLSNYFNTSPDDDFYNYPGHDYQDLPRGILTLGGVKFDVRGLIALTCNFSLLSTRVLMPVEVDGIKVNQKGKKLHFLQACGFGAKPDTKVGEYVIHYVDGQTRSIPVVFLKNTTDWWVKPTDLPLPDAVEVWRGQNPSSRNSGAFTHLLKYTWENPLPDVEVSTIDFVSTFNTGAPFLVAITLE
jgi:hypothetical protein